MIGTSPDISKISVELSPTISSAETDPIEKKIIIIKDDMIIFIFLFILYLHNHFSIN